MGDLDPPAQSREKFNEQSSLNTSLHLAMANFNDTKIIVALLKNGANVYALNDNKETPLDIAVRLNKINCVKLLLKKMIDDKEESIDLHQSVRVAVLNRNLEIFQYLILHCTDDRIRNRWIPKEIIDDKSDQYQKYIEIFLKHNFMFDKTEIERFNDEGKTPLHVACESSNLKIVKILLHSKADVNVRAEKDGWTPLHFAIEKYIVAKKTYVTTNSQYCNGGFFNALFNSFFDTPEGKSLRLSIDRSKEVITLLLQHKANIKAQSTSVDSPLFIAYSNNDQELTKLLLMVK